MEYHPKLTIMKRFIFSLITLGALYAYATPIVIKPGLYYTESSHKF